MFGQWLPVPRSEPLVFIEHLIRGHVFGRAHAGPMGRVKTRLRALAFDFTVFTGAFCVVRQNALSRGFVRGFANCDHVHSMPVYKGPAPACVDRTPWARTRAHRVGSTRPPGDQQPGHAGPYGHGQKYVFKVFQHNDHPHQK